MVIIFMVITEISNRVPPMEPTRILLINQQIEPHKKPNLSFMPLRTNTEYVPMALPNIDHNCQILSAK